MMNDSLWTRCNSCQRILYKQDILDNSSVCPACNFHFRISSTERLGMLFDDGRFETLDENIFPVQAQVGKPVIIGLSYPSAGNSASGCLPKPGGGCLDWTALNRPNPDITTISLDLQQQFDIYDAFLNAVNGRTWVSGVVSRGYFPPAALQDKSASVHGKPAADLLWFWFPRLLGNVK